MFAVIKTGGKQYKVAKDDVLILERLNGAEGDLVSFGEVLMMGTEGDVTIGEPNIDGAQVNGELLETRKGKKINVFKFKRRKNYRRNKGHRQIETVVRITDILAKGEKPTAKKVAAKPTAKKAAPKPVTKKAEPKADTAKKPAAKPVAKKAEPKQAAPKKAAPTKPAAKKTAPKKPAAKKAAPKKKD